MKTSPRRLQCFNNVVYGLREYGLLDYTTGIVRSVADDRVYLDCLPQIREAISCNPSFLPGGICKNHGATAVSTWREDATTASMQVTLHQNGRDYWIEVDFDEGNPVRDVEGTARHLFEVVRNKVCKKKTDPFLIRDIRAKHGCSVPPVVV